MANVLTPKQATFVTEHLGVALPISSRTEPGNFVQKRAFLVARWKQIAADLVSEVETVRSTVAAKLPHEDSDQFAKVLGSALVEIVDDLKSSVDDAVIASINAGDPKYAAVSDRIAKLRSDVSGNQLIAALRDNSLAPGQPIEKAITAALNEVQAELTT
mgnify:FL=1